MEIKQTILELGFDLEDFELTNNAYVYQIPNSDLFASLYGLLDDSELFTEDLDAQNITLFGEDVTFIDEDGEVSINLVANFEKDQYQLIISEAA